MRMIVEIFMPDLEDRQTHRQAHTQTHTHDQMMSCFATKNSTLGYGVGGVSSLSLGLASQADLFAEGGRDLPSFW